LTELKLLTVVNHKLIDTLATLLKNVLNICKLSLGKTALLKKVDF